MLCIHEYGDRLLDIVLHIAEIILSVEKEKRELYNTYINVLVIPSNFLWPTGNSNENRVAHRIKTTRLPVFDIPDFNMYIVECTLLLSHKCCTI